jgi:hypothetical protein
MMIKEWKMHSDLGDNSFLIAPLHPSLSLFEDASYYPLLPAGHHVSERNIKRNNRRLHVVSK